MGGYLSRRSRFGDEHARREFDRRVWDLYDEYLRHPDVGICGDHAGPIQCGRYTLDSYLMDASAKVLREERDSREDLARSARSLAIWGLRETPEKNSQVAATFAVQVMYDRVYRGMIRAYLGAPRPTRWWWTNDPKPQQHYHGAADEFVPPILGVEIARIQRIPVQGEGFLWEPEWPIRRSYTRQMDCLRPPLMAVRLAAHLIEQHCYTQDPKVLALELGHAIGPQALSTWLPRADVCTWSLVFDPHVSPEIPRAGADVVILGIPTLRRLVYTRVMGDPDIHVDGRVVDRFWERIRDRDPLEHVKLLVDVATDHLKLGGIVVIIGAAEEGEHHRATQMMEHAGIYKPITTGKPAQVAYKKIPWCPYWVLPPEDRLVSAYRRVG